MAELGTAFVDIEGDWSKFQSQTQKKGSGLGGVFGKIGKAAGVALIAGAAGAVAGGVASVFKAADFDKGMREVFTLLPGISGDAMSEMEGQVKSFSSELGVLPSETVPALYQAISAGVPKDNVFNFLETAQRAAKGGVTDLETAVDGISSVVNAYGDDVLSAAEASDAMFTAVRLGKTDFGELSSSLFNVIPTASSLGVQFGDVTAALASMTAQGVPTSVATTQLRQLFVELSKEGSNTAETFENIAGKSFQEFIAEGGNTQQALELMGTAAAEEGQNISDMFGSVEAGAAALALSGQNAEGYADNIAAMGDSAGATDAAFQTMNGGLSATMDRLKAKFEVFMITLGQKLLPIVEQVVTWFETKAIPALGDFAAVVADRVGPIIADLVGWFRDDFLPAAQTAFEWLRDEAFPVAQDIAAVVGERLLGAFKSVSSFITGTLIPTIQNIVGWFRRNQDVAVALGIAVGTLVVGLYTYRTVVTVITTVTKLWAAAQALLNSAFFLSPIGLVVVGIAALAAGFYLAYQRSETFRDIIDAIGRFFRDTLLPIFQDTWDWIKSNWPLLLAILTGPIGLAVLAIIKNWDKITEGFSRVKDWIGDRVGEIVGFITGIPGRIAGVVSTMWNGLRDGITAAKDWVANRISDIVGFVTGIPGRIADVVSTLWNPIQDGITAARDWVFERFDDVVEFVAGLPGRIGAAASGMWDGITNAFRSAIDGVKGIWNAFARFWNRIELRVPSIDIPLVGSVGGFTVGLPDLPQAARGMIVPGVMGQAVPILAHGGEMVFNRSQQAELFRLAQGRGTQGGRSDNGPREVVHVDGDLIISDPVDLDALFRRANFAMAST